MHSCAGDVLLRVDRRNGRCGASNVNPATGQRDLDVPGALRGSFGGDQVTVPEHNGSTELPVVGPRASQATSAFICRGCYFI